jgi:hypothetical protein
MTALASRRSGQEEEGSSQGTQGSAGAWLRIQLGAAVGSDLLTLLAN